MKMTQLDISSLLPPVTEKTAPVLLKEGDTVYLVVKGDIEEYFVAERTWTYGNNDEERGYRIINKISSSDYFTNNKELSNSIAFTDFDAAKKKALEYLAAHPNVIMAGDIKPLSVTAYSYIRKIDNRKLISYCCDLGDDTYYLKGFITYEHIIIGKKKALKEFKNQTEMEKAVEYSDFEPEFKNMYKCTDLSNWDYGESKYNYAIG